MIAGKDAPRVGEAKNSWLTGTAAWNYFAISQFILGIRPEFKGLRIDPCLPNEIDSCEIVRYFRGTKYIIKITNNGTNKGIDVENGVLNDNIVSSHNNECIVNVRL